MKREGIVIAIALVAHGGFLLGARSFPKPTWLVARMGSGGAMTIVDLGGSPSAPGAPQAVIEQPAATIAPEPATAEPATAEPSSLEPSHVERADPAEAAEPSAPPAEREVVAQPPSATGDDVIARAETPPSNETAPGATTTAPTPDSADTWSSPSSESPPTSLSGLLGPSLSGLNVARQVAIDGAAPSAAPTTTPAAPTVDKKKANDVLASTIVGQDRQKGIDLPATGIVVSSVSDAARALPVPHNTRASFEVKLGPGGKVAGVRVMSSSGGDAAAWEGAAKAVASSLSAKSLSLGDAAKSGATIVVGVTVKHVYPTATAKGADVKPVCANQIINDIADAADNKAAPAPESTVPLFQDENGRPCIPIGIGGTADAANIGAKKQIQVHTTSKVLVGGKEALPTVEKVNKDPFWLPSTKEGPRPVAPYKMRKYKRDREKKK